MNFNPMKTQPKTLQLKAALAALALLAAPALRAELVVNYANKGTDLFLNPPAGTFEMPLDEARPAAWDAPGDSRGVFDNDKWAVVFKYSSVTIRTNVTVRFRNHAANPPVVWLVDGDVTIAGTVDLSGQVGRDRRPAVSGPGGFSGGVPADSVDLEGGPGLGPGGATPTGSPWSASNRSTSGSYGPNFRSALSPYAGTAYGNAQILPLIGGSGGAGTFFDGHLRPAAGAGGGALLIVAKGRIVINGQVLANGGGGTSLGGAAAGGSGGAVRLVADSISGVGIVSAQGGSAGSGSHMDGGPGRIRLEADNPAASGLRIEPATLAVRPEADAVTGIRIWPPANAPQARIVSINGVAVPTVPTGSMEGAADLALPNSGNAVVVIETTNFSPSGSVKIRVTPRRGAAFELDARPLSDPTPTVARTLWVAETPLHLGFCSMQVRAVQP